MFQTISRGDATDTAQDDIAHGGTFNIPENYQDTHVDPVAIAATTNDPEEPEEAVLQRVGIIDLHGTSVNEMDQERHAVETAIRQCQETLFVPRSSVPVSEFQNPLLWSDGFPTLFPLGLGGADDIKRPVKLSLKEWARHMLNLSDDRFRLHPDFIFVVYNIIQRRQVLQQSRLKVKYGQSGQFDADKLLAMSMQDLEQVRKDIAAGKSLDHGSSFFALANVLRSVGGKVEGSAFAKGRQRREMKSLMVALGLPSIWLTVSPTDAHSPLVLHFGGKAIDLDTPWPKELGTYQDRCRFVSADPSAASQFFYTVAEAAIKALIVGLGKQGGLFGQTNGHYGCIEAQGRGTLHFHMLVWLRDMPGPDKMEELVKNDSAFKEELLIYLASIISESLPEIISSEQSDLLLDSQRDPNDFHVNCKPVPDPGLPKDVLLRDISELVRANQLHGINAGSDRTCPRSCFSHGGGDNCKSWFPRETVLVPFLDQSGPHLKRNHSWVNNYNPTMLQAMRCSDTTRIY